MNLHVYFYEAFEEEQREIERFLNNDITADFTWKTIQEIAHDDPPAGIISVRTQSLIPDHWADKIDGILTRSTGYDHISRYRLSCGQDVKAGYLPLYCNRAVAEQAMLLWTALLRKFPKQVKQFKNFHRDGITGMECKGKNIAIFGVGNIGYQIVRIARGLEMNVLAVDPVEKHNDVEYTTEKNALENADIIVCSMNLTEENNQYFNKERLANTNDGIYFINIARGELCVPSDLLQMLKSGKLNGVGMDVYPDEQRLAVALRGCDLATMSPSTQATLELTHHPKVICTPHNAFNTQEAVQLKASQSVEAIIEFLAKNDFPHPITRK